MHRGGSLLPMAPLRLGISACLLGQAVRWDGGHQRDPFLAATLGRFVEWVPVCPEVELGLGVPREPIRLEGDPAALRLVAANSRRDLTRAMTRFARARAALAAFHAVHEHLLRAHDPATCRRLGALVANAGKRPLRVVVADYGAGFMEALRTQASPPTRRRAPQRPAPPAPRRSPTARPAASRPAPRRPRSSP